MADTDDHHDCSETLEELYSFLDGQLTDAKRAAIEQHLDDCPPCFEAYDFEAEIREYISQRCREQVPDDLKRRIAHALASETGGEAGDESRTGGAPA